MKVESKFLTAEVKIVKVRLAGRVLVIEGMVKGFMPMTVRVDPADALQLLRALSLPLRTRLGAALPPRVVAALPARLKAMVLPSPTGGNGAGEVRP